MLFLLLYFTDDSVIWIAFCASSSFEVHKQQSEDGVPCQFEKGNLGSLVLKVYIHKITTLGFINISRLTYELYTIKSCICIWSIMKISHIHALLVLVAGLAWSIGSCIILINLFYLSSQCVYWIHTSTRFKPIQWAIGILGSIGLLAYASFIGYLALRNDRTETYILHDMQEMIDPFEDEKSLSVEMNEHHRPLTIVNSNQLSVK